MMMSKVREEADLYKDLPTKKLKKVIRKYKFLSLSNSELFNFIFYLLTLSVPFIIVFGFSTTTIFWILVIHYFFYWLFLFKYKKFKLVSDQEREEIDEIIQILTKYLQDKENKKPL